jgi:invasion protein IalB
MMSRLATAHIRARVCAGPLAVAAVVVSTQPSLSQSPASRGQGSIAAPAQTQQAAPVGAEPQLTTAAFGDWILRCVRQTEGSVTRRICEVSQSLQVQGGQGPVAQVAFGRLERSQPLRLTALLPNNISLPSTVRALADENDSQPVELAWRRCLPGGCVAEIEISQAALQRLRTQSDVGRISFKDAGNRDVVLPVSLRGLAQALDAYGREN